jgi:hypothetical protein
MAQTNWTGPLASGDRPAGFPGGSNVGFVVLSQTLTIDADDTTVQNGVFRLPRGSQIIDFKVDCRTVFNGTTPVLSAGTASGGTQYLSGIAMGTTGRKGLGLTAAQIENLQDIGTNREVVVTVTGATASATGRAFVEIQYVQKTADD